MGWNGVECDTCPGTNWRFCDDCEARIDKREKPDNYQLLPEWASAQSQSMTSAAPRKSICTTAGEKLSSVMNSVGETFSKVRKSLFGVRQRRLFSPQFVKLCEE